MRTPWCDSYVCFRPRRIAIVSATDGSPTKIGWKRRSSAASFSMCFRYSSSVVAPMQRSSPRASIGFRRLAASTAPSAAPAPTIVGAGAAEGAVDAASLLKPMLARGELRCIGATTLDEYRKHIEKDAALER